MFNPMLLIALTVPVNCPVPTWQHWADKAPLTEDYEKMQAIVDTDKCKERYAKAPCLRLVRVNKSGHWGVLCATELGLTKME